MLVLSFLSTNTNCTVPTLWARRRQKERVQSFYELDASSTPLQTGQKAHRGLVKATVSSTEQNLDIQLGPENGCTRLPECLSKENSNFDL